MPFKFPQNAHQIGDFLRRINDLSRVKGFVLTGLKNRFNGLKNGLLTLIGIPTKGFRYANLTDYGLLQ